MAKSMGYNQASGVSGMLKSGHQTYEGTYGAVLKNIEAGKSMASMVQTSLGPYGMNKLVVNHLEKIFVTSDCATILRELEVAHPAARMLVLAAQMQEQEYGDNTNFVVSFAGELLKMAEELIKQGLHTAEILSGYTRAYNKLLEMIPSLVAKTVVNVRDPVELAYSIRSVIGTKQCGFENNLSDLVAKSALITVPPKKEKPSLNMDSVRIAKIRGGSQDQSSMLKGMVLIRDTEGLVKRKANAKVVVFGCGFEASSAEAKGTILISNAQELLNYNKSEERKMEEMVSNVASCGVDVVICNGTISEMALHFLDKHNIMVIKCSSKFDTKRLCLAMGCTAMLRLGPASPEEMGFCSLIEVKEIASRKVIVFSQELDEDTAIATVILRASTENVLNDLERSIDDGVHAVKAIMEDGRLLAGAGAIELELGKRLKKFAEEVQGLDQYGINKFAEALDVVPRTLCENSGCDVTAVMHSLHQAHDGSTDSEKMGFDIDDCKPVNSCDKGIYDIYVTKLNALRLAVDAALTILKIDQIVMSKPAGGPKPREAGPMDM